MEVKKMGLILLLKQRKTNKKIESSATPEEKEAISLIKKFSGRPVEHESVYEPMPTPKLGPGGKRDREYLLIEGFLKSYPGYITRASENMRKAYGIN